MSEIPENFKYSKTHEWVYVEENGEITIGITAHAQSLLGDMVFVELPELREAFKAGEEIGVLESVKAAADLYAPLSGNIVEVNDKLVDSPSLVNSDPYGDGWLFKIKASDEAELQDLLDANAYAELIAEES